MSRISPNTRGIPVLLHYTAPAAWRSDRWIAERGLMNVEIRMSGADPNAVRAQGEVRKRGTTLVIDDDVRVRIGVPRPCNLVTGSYTYAFGIDRDATFTLTAVNAANNTELKSVPYKDAEASEVLRFMFEVP